YSRAKAVSRGVSRRIGHKPGYFGELFRREDLSSQLNSRLGYDQRFVHVGPVKDDARRRHLDFGRHIVDRPGRLRGFERIEFSSRFSMSGSQDDAIFASLQLHGFLEDGRIDPRLAHYLLCSMLMQKLNISRFTWQARCNHGADCEAWLVD